MSIAPSTPSSIDPQEVARFAALADDWWDPHGALASLHKINPVRLAFIRKQALARFGRDGRTRAPFTGLRLLDIGCGGGLLCEPMARLGFDVVGVDAAERNVSVAAAHAQSVGLAIDYRATTAETLLIAEPQRFDVILNMEVIEHVADPGAFLRDCAGLLKPGGLMVVATLNRTLKAFALAKIGAEYILGWVPAGAHDWRKFLKPEELSGYLAGSEVQVAGPFGIAFYPASGAWRGSSDCAINYMMTVTKD